MGVPTRSQGCTCTVTPSLWSRCTAWSSHRCVSLPRGARSSCWANSATATTPSIACAVERLRQDFDQPLRIERLAHELGMSVSGLQHHFKAVTAMSPVQFQKRLRLLEARRLMLGQDLDAASAAYRVGYRDASHFNREYKSLFGVPPMRDVQRLREAALAIAGL